jgi:hypothetical protein
MTFSASAKCRRSIFPFMMHNALETISEADVGL